MSNVRILTDIPFYEGTPISFGMFQKKGKKSHHVCFKNAMVGGIWEFKLKFVPRGLSNKSGLRKHRS